MKKLIIAPTFASIAAAGLCMLCIAGGSLPAFAVNSDLSPAASPSPSAAVAASGSAAPIAAATAPVPRPAPTMHGMLSPEEQNELMTAMEKAKTDPNVKKAANDMQEIRLAVRSAMVEKDKSIGAIFDKMDAARKAGGPRMMLSPDDRQKLQAASSVVMSGTVGQAMMDTTTKYREALHTAMVAADPKIESILEKLPRGPMGGGRPAPLTSGPAHPGIPPTVVTTPAVSAPPIPATSGSGK